jgi:hypothetical protein
MVVLPQAPRAKGTLATVVEVEVQVVATMVGLAGPLEEMNKLHLVGPMVPA